MTDSCVSTRITMRVELRRTSSVGRYSIYEARQLDASLSDVGLDSIIAIAASPENAARTTLISERHHWQTLSAMNGILTGKPTADIAAVIDSIRQASGLYTLFKGTSVPFERNADGEHLRESLRALTTFQREVGWASLVALLLQHSHGFDESASRSRAAIS